MSLLDSPTHLAMVWPEVSSTDGDLNVVRRPGPVPVTVAGRLQPVSSSEQVAAGQLVTGRYRFLCRSWPAGPFARVEVDGRAWDVEGEPLVSSGSEATRHVTVTLRSRTPRGA